MSIRPARTGDLQRMAEIDPHVQGSAHRLDLLSRSIEAASCFIAEEDDSLLGYVLLDYSFYGNGFIPLLFVAESSRRSKVGTTLMLEAARRCRTRKLFTSTNVSNLPMQALLLKLGYEISGIVHNLDPDDPEVIYFRKNAE